MHTPFRDGVNALCWERSLPGDFSDVVASVGPIDEITTLDEAALRALSLSSAGQAAREILLRDQEALRRFGLAPILDCIPAYPRDTEPGPVPVDVYSFHVDSATVAADTYLCSYNEVSSEGLRNEEAVRHVDVPETRAKLLELFGGRDDEGFIEWLNDQFYNLHYAQLPQARPFAFGLGNMWRIATEYPGSPVPPCIHRAPTTIPGRPPRLLLIS